MLWLCLMIFFAHKIDLRSINYGVITLLPKGDDADRIQKYRPICLLQVLFKIFTKTLTVRTEPVMGKLIDTCQTAFIKGRFIADGVTLLHEILKESKSQKQQGVVLKFTLRKLITRSIGIFCFTAVGRKV